MSNSAARPDQERRRNAALRKLIDELLFRVRDAHQRLDLWTPEERAQAEAELSAIMSRVQGAALPRVAQDDVKTNAGVAAEGPRQ